MKHTLKITAILIIMFLLTQLIGLAVIKFYQDGNELPYRMEPPKENDPSLTTGLTSIFSALLIVIVIFFLLTRIKAKRFIRLWFFTVSVIAIGLTITVVSTKLTIIKPSIIALLIAVPLAYLEIYKKNILILNINKFLVYPGIAVIFVLFLTNMMGKGVILGIIIILLVISLYDIWAVWQSKIMQKMAKYQIQEIGIFGGFFVPYASKRQKNKIKLLKQKYKNKSEKARENAFKKSKIKVNLLILGGGDVVFPLITAGIFYVTFGLLSSLIIISSAALGLLYLSLITKKGKFYPAMPFLTIPMYLGMMLSWLIL